MPRERFENNAASTLSVAVSSNTQATLTLQSGHGARFPYLAVPDFFWVTLDDGTNVEVCKCVDRSGDVLTVLRGQQGTTAQSSFATGTKVEARITEETMRHGTMFQGASMIWMRPNAATSSWHLMGVTVPTVIGSATPFTLNNSEWKTTQALIRYQQTNSAQSPSHWRYANNAMNIGRGFRFRGRFAPNLCPNSSHFFFGLVGTTGAVTSVHPPSSLTNAIVVGYANAAQGTNLSLWRNDGSGNAVQLDLGSYFTATSAAAYELELSSVGSESRVNYVVRRLDISSISEAYSYFTSDIPSNSQWLMPYAQMTSMVTSTGQWDHMGVWWDT